MIHPLLMRNNIERIAAGEARTSRLREINFITNRFATLAC